MEPETDLHSPELYFNRELSWLEFNDRVLREGINGEVPLLERLKFLAIVSSNLDEFFMVRVAGLKQQVAAGKLARDASGLSAAEQLARIAERTHRMVAEQSAGIHQAFGQLAPHGLRVLAPEAWTEAQRRFLHGYFTSEVLPLLTPLAVEELDPFPILPGLSLNVLAALTPAGEPDAEERLAVVPIPGTLARFVPLPVDKGVCLARLEDAVAASIGDLFHGYTVQATTPFRITRDADVPVTDDDADDLLQVVEAAVRSRRHQAPVRLELSADCPPRLRQWLEGWCGLADDDAYGVHGMLDAKALFEIVGRPGFNRLREPDWPQQPPRDLLGTDDLWAAIQDHDVLLSHPYETFDPVVHLLDLAAEDPQVMAIKQTLYRVSGNSPIIAALARASENGKQVTVLVELKARFDEANNINWARRLEDTGCHVIYGIAGLKTHAKLLLIIRREAHGICRYVHTGTGNYNDKTARLYSDMGLLTTDRDFAADASAFFNLLTGYSQPVGWKRFVLSPTDSRRSFIELIDREIRATTPDQPGLIMAKMNSLQDKAICQALYRASRAGVRVRLNVRGICCLRPGVEGVSDHIEVTSIVDRYLEHTRAFYFRNGGHEEVYLASADWMERNLDKRLEIIFPITAPDLRNRLISMLEVYFADNVKARRLRSDGAYVPVGSGTTRVRAQQHLYRDAVAAAQVPAATALQFRPMTAPERDTP